MLDILSKRKSKNKNGRSYFPKSRKNLLRKLLKIKKTKTVFSLFKKKYIQSTIKRNSAEFKNKNTNEIMPEFPL